MNFKSMHNWEESRLIEQVISLRHLLSNSWLPKSHHKVDNDLISELILLKDDDNPLEWLKQNKRELISSALLWTVLEHLRSFIQGSLLARKAGHSTTFTIFEQWLGRAINLPENAQLFQKIADSHSTTVSPRLLRTVFQECHVLLQQNGMKVSINEITDDEIWLCLIALLQMPIDSDPLERIEKNYLQLAAETTLRHLFSQIWPPRHNLVGQTNTGIIEKVLHPKIRQRAAGVSVTLQDLTLGKSSFALTLKTRVSEKAISLPQNVIGKGIWWQGVDRVTDNVGNHYLVCHRLEEGENRFWWFDQSLQLVCYPAIAPQATKIMLRSCQMALVLVGVLPGKQWRKPRPLRQLDLGNLTWDVEVARL